ncbi:MAG: AAA family ATPase, partial [Salinisphaera sp.]|nr:AAA family ATPase [Salinisphaera sp.]
MYLRFYGLQDHPFAVTPDPGYLYLSPHHREALGHLLYGVGEYGGFVALFGEVGTGKTTLIRALLEQEHAELDVALCLNPKLTVLEFVAQICDELGAPRPAGAAGTIKDLVDALNAHLLETHGQGRRTVVIVDEAQNLDRDVLEQLRLLTNLETRKHKLLRIILVGQPELEAMLRRPDLRQLAQRITARYSLCALNRQQTSAYISHRLRVAGGAPSLFDKRACNAVHRATGGVPRLINTVCERALLGGYGQGARNIDARTVRRAARETLPVGREPIAGRVLAPTALLVATALLAFGLHFALRQWHTSEIPAGIAQAEAAEPSAGRGDDEAPESLGHTEVAVESASAPALDEPAPAPSPDVQPRGKDAPAATPTVVEKVPAVESEPLQFPRGDVELAQLLRLWGIFGQPGNLGCADLAIGDLHCLRERGDLADLARFDRPAMLTLQQGDERARVILTGLDDKQAALLVADGARVWPRSRLARLWTGEYRMVWRLQAPVRRVVPGSIGDGVVWVRERLALAAGQDLDHQPGK